MPVISVIIPAHNRSHLLARALASLPEVPANALEVIVVDDGSTDDIGLIVRTAGRKITFLRQGRAGGPGAARNLGLEAASGEYVAFLDSDDVWLPWTLPIYQRVLRQYPGASFIAGSPFSFAEEREIAAAAAATADELDARIYPDYFASAAHPIWLGASCLLVRRDRCPRFEPSHMNAEDLDFALHFGVEPGFVWIRQPCTFGYRRHGPTAVGNFARTLKGINHLVDDERDGRYPGGDARRRERLALITRAVRPPVVEGLKRGQRQQAWYLYRRTFGWHLVLRRWKFLVACPALLLPVGNRQNRLQDCPADLRMSDAADRQCPAGTRAQVSAVIPTKDRKDMLRQVLHALQRQTILAEIICVDDGSTDGTAAMLSTEFPQVRTLRHEASRGPAAARNAGAKVASGEFLLTLDDDCILAAADAVERTLELFDHPDVAGVTLPFVNVRMDRGIRTAAPETDRAFVTTDYYAGMVILRRDNFLQAGGYREPFFMQGEEADLAIRLLDKRRFIRNGLRALIDHHESPVRDRLKLWRLGAQNAILFAVYNVPWPWFPIHLGSTIVKTLIYAWRRGRAIPALQGFCAAIPIARRTLGLRAPVTGRTYLAFRTLKSGSVLPLDRMQEVLGHD